ncbi:MAG: tripartite tricarboxylate transporter TctB family protein [Burkholderiales bacterium]
MKIKSQEDFWSGLMFIGFGIAAIVIARDYPFGSAMRMGPGYFPSAIGGCLITLGAIIAAISFKTPGVGIGPWPWRAMTLMSVAFVIFAWGMEHIGFIPSLAILIAVSTLSTPHFRWKEMAIEMVVMIAGSWAVFIYALELPFPLWGGY